MPSQRDLILAQRRAFLAGVGTACRGCADYEKEAAERYPLTVIEPREMQSRAWSHSTYRVVNGVLQIRHGIDTGWATVQALMMPDFSVAADLLANPNTTKEL